MNIGKDNRHPRYICDKCREPIYYIGQKGFVGINHYYKSTKNHTPSKSFDLCENCEKKFREWLEIRELPTIQDIISRFPVYEEEQ